MLNLDNIVQRVDIPTSASVLDGSKQTLGQEQARSDPHAWPVTNLLEPIVLVSASIPARSSLKVCNWHE